MFTFLFIISFIAVFLFMLGFLSNDEDTAGIGLFCIVVITLFGWGAAGNFCVSESKDTAEQWTVVKTPQSLSLVEGNNRMKVTDIEEFQLLDKQTSAEVTRTRNYNIYGRELTGTVRLNKAKLLLSTLPKKVE